MTFFHFLPDFSQLYKGHLRSPTTHNNWRSFELPIFQLSLFWNVTSIFSLFRFSFISWVCQKTSCGNWRKKLRFSLLQCVLIIVIVHQMRIVVILRKLCILWEFHRISRNFILHKPRLNVQDDLFIKDLNVKESNWNQECTVVVIRAMTCLSISLIRGTLDMTYHLVLVILDCSRTIQMFAK